VTNGATGQEPQDFTVSTAVVSLRAWYLCEVLYAPISAAIRTSIAVFLLRLANTPLHKAIIWVNLILTWILSLAFFLILLLQCLPLDNFWARLRGQPGKCVDHDVVINATIVHSVLSATSDIVLALLPVALLWRVQLDRGTKVSISLLLSLGIV